MGCLNEGNGFLHWFGNIHLNGPCNRACYFCIGQHMMALDKLNTLDSWPLPGLEAFVGMLKKRGIKEVNLTGSNTDPLLYNHLGRLVLYLRKEIPGVTLGIRTNGVAGNNIQMVLFDKASISITTLDPELYVRTMGIGVPPNVKQIIKNCKDHGTELKVNMVLCPETLGTIINDIKTLASLGITKINLREPYGQPHVGNPLESVWEKPDSMVHGMPQYVIDGCIVTYWDVHFVEVESLNLYASGHISEYYSVTRGHEPNGFTQPQSEFPFAGRVREQWVKS